MFKEGRKQNYNKSYYSQNTRPFCASKISNLHNNLPK